MSYDRWALPESRSGDSPIVFTDEFTRALNLLASGANLFLTGKAGTGKSTLIRHFIATTDRRVVVAAPTGIAALNVDGYTIHRLFSFNPTTDLATVRSGDYYPYRFAKTLQHLDTLILDEASMVRADLFDMLVAALERFGPRRGSLFGGVQLVLVGDLFQLPPVVTESEKEFFATRYATPYFFSADQFSLDDFATVALTRVFRQLGDQRLTDLLNAVREGVLLDRWRTELNTRTQPGFEPPDDEFWLTLAPTNRVVRARNRTRLERLPGELLVHHAQESGDLSLFDSPADDVVELKVGAQVMMLANDPGDRWVNGTLGRVLAIHDADDVAVLVEFRDGNTAWVRPHTWDVTAPVVERGTLRHEVVGAFTQLPLKLAWAITIHKSQGQTLDRLVVDLSGGTFDYGQVYVALSRCTSMDGLVLIWDVLPKDLKTDRRVVRFLRSATTSTEPARPCAIAILPIGREGRMSRPRPVELAVAFDDGTAVSTLVNPQRDLEDARTAYGVSVDDVLLAPNLAEAWLAVAPMLDGCVPVGVDIDETMGLIDFELKRLGVVVPLPVGIDLRPALTPDPDLSGPTALGRARAAMRLLKSSGLDVSGGSVFGESVFDDDAAGADADPDSASGPGPSASEPGPTYLLTRDPDAAPPHRASRPTLDALIATSRLVSAVILGNGNVTMLDQAGSSVVRAVVAERLAAAACRTAGLPPDLVDKLDELDKILGTDIVANITAALPAVLNVDEVLCPGTRVCFTGEAIDPSGRRWGREEIMAAAEECGLRPVYSVTKTRCDVLVVAEVGTQSSKARKAKEFGKAVLSAEEFFAWLAHAQG